MYKNLPDYYAEEKDKLLKSCAKCGNCIAKCRIMPYITPNKSPKEIQADILTFFKTGELSDDAALKVQACMRCFGCLDVKCPIGVNSITINDLVLHDLEEKKENPWSQDVFALQRQLAIENSTPKEYKKITTPRIKEDSKYVFFPGCNVYKQPDKLLNALDIIDSITDDYSFIPGLTSCCGSACRSVGNHDKEYFEGNKLMEQVAKLKPETLILWCPTCFCQTESRIKLFRDTPCRCVTFGQFVYGNIEKLDLSHAKPHKVTFHEPCKTSYMRLDTESVRNILRLIPGTELVEMEHHGENTMCCGCGTITQYPDMCDKVTTKRLDEAKSTGADTLIDVCHNCHLIFKPCQKRHPGYDFRIENYSAYILRAMGKERRDTLE